MALSNTDKFKFANETTYPTREVKKIVRWVLRYLDVCDQPCMVKIKHHNRGHAYSGRFYQDPRSSGAYIYNFDKGNWRDVAPNVPRDMHYLITARLGKEGVYPTQVNVYNRREAPEPWIVNTWQEALVCIMAHEAMHLRQHTVEVARNRGKYNEVDTEWAALRLLTSYREEFPTPA